jgi:catechol 2,3-dioxygenase-like lactoylglutathione lyase family enzyme
MTPALTLLVLRVTDLERSRAFYAALGLAPVAEQHGRGPAHYSCTLGALVLELYPARPGEAVGGLRLGLRVPTETVAALAAGGWIVEGHVVRDPDSNVIALELY